MSDMGILAQFAMNEGESILCKLPKSTLTP